MTFRAEIRGRRGLAAALVATATGGCVSLKPDVTILPGDGDAGRNVPAGDAAATDGADGGPGALGADASEGTVAVDSNEDAGIVLGAGEDEPPDGPQEAAVAEAGLAEAGLAEAGLAEAGLAEAGGDAGASTDGAGPDGPPAVCDLSAPFTAVEMVAGSPPLSTGSGGTLSPDELEVWWSSSGSLWTATRGDVTQPFGFYQSMATFTGADDYPTITGDLTKLFFLDDGDLSLRVAMRSNSTMSFALGGPLPSTTGNSAFSPFVTDGSILYFALASAGGLSRLYFATFSDAGFAAPEEVPGIVSTDPTIAATYEDTFPVVSIDATAIYWARTDVTQDVDHVYVARRSTPAGSFGGVMVMSGVDNLRPTWLSPDGCRLYLTAAGLGLYVAER